MDRIHVSRFSFRRKSSRREKEKERELSAEFDYETLTYLRYSSILFKFKHTFFMNV